MDLETLIPILLVVAVYLYKAFENARKKDKKEGQPASGPAPRPRKAPQTVRESAGREPFAGGGRDRELPGAAPVPERSRPAEREWWDLEVPQASKETVYQEPAPPKMQRERLTPEKFRGETIKTDDLSNPEKITRDLRARAKVASPLQLEPEVHMESEAEHEYADFDLQDAVIKSAILERREF